MTPKTMTEQPADRSTNTDLALPGPTYLHWSSILAGAIVAAAVSFVLLSFGSGIGLAVASPSSTWRDSSAALALVGGLWILIDVACLIRARRIPGRSPARSSWSDATPDAVDFRDGIHGLVVWGLAIIIGAFLALSATRMVAGRTDLTAPTAATAEPLLAFELDQLFRSDRTPAELGDDPELRAQAARIITAGRGRARPDQLSRSRLFRARPRQPGRRRASSGV